MDRKIKFRHLDAFSAIARARSFKMAAEQLSLTQPAISKTLKELEEILGVVVMERSRAGVSLTPEGEVFLHLPSKVPPRCAMGCVVFRRRASRQAS